MKTSAAPSAEFVPTFAHVVTRGRTFTKRFSERVRLATFQTMCPRSNVPSAIPLPSPLDETPTPCPRDVIVQLETAFALHHGRTPRIAVLAHQNGDRAAHVAVGVGDDERIFELDVFARAPLDVAVSVVDAVLPRIVAFVKDPSGRAPVSLDWAGQKTESVVFVRGELRAYRLEREAAALLGDDVTPQRFLTRWQND
jgi:hypothetical protein